MGRARRFGAAGPRVLCGLSAVAVVAAMSAGWFAAAIAGASSRAWSATAATVPFGASTGASATLSIGAATCPAPGSCVAVGSFAVPAPKPTKPTTRPHRPLSELYSSGTWTAVPLPIPNGAGTGPTAQASLNAVTCTEPATCVAVGDYSDATGKDHGLIEILAGTTWSAATAPEPATAGTGANQEADLRAVACSGSGFCVAGGTYFDATGHGNALAITMSNGAWTAARAPEPLGAGMGSDQKAAIESVTCPLVGTCVAGGWFKNTVGGEPPYVLTLSGGRWTPSALTLPPGAATGSKATGTTTSVSCISPASCVAVGLFIRSASGSAPLISTLSGGSWSSIAPPEPPGAPSGATAAGRLISVACHATVTCTAVGTYKNVTGHNQPLVETLAGGFWTAITGPEPAGAGTGAHQKALLDSVSCAVSGSCTAVGSYQDGTGQTLGLIDTLSHGTWSAVTAPEPTGAQAGSSLATVACVGGGCVAGGRFKTAGGAQGLLETSDMTPSGYFQAASDGGVFAYNVPFLGSEGGKTLVAPVVASAADTVTGGYYEAAADGGIFAFTAPFHGSMGGRPLAKPVVGMAYDTRTGGYYEVASDGGIFAFTAPFHGSMGGRPLVAPIVGMAFDAATGGYYEVAADGGIFAFTAPFVGSEGGKALAKPVVGMAYDSLTGGYYEVASDGGIFAFAAPFDGSMGGKPLVAPIVGMGFDWGTGGYDEVAADGGIFAFTAPFLGSQGGKHLNKPVVSISLG